MRETSHKFKLQVNIEVASELVLNITENITVFTCDLHPKVESRKDLGRKKDHRS